MILFGFRSKRRRLGVVRSECPRCHQTCAQAIAHAQRWFTLFFIPIFPFSSSHVTVCSMCSSASRIDRATAEHLVRLGTQQVTQAPGAVVDNGAAETPFPPLHAPEPPTAT